MPASALREARGHGVPLSLRQGQTPFDVADEGLVEHLEMLQKKQSVVSLLGCEAVPLSRPTQAARPWASVTSAFGEG